MSSDRVTRKSSGKKCYILLVSLFSGPRNCGWQELKDYLRDYAKIRPGNTDLSLRQDDGMRIGTSVANSREEADRAYDYFVANGWHGEAVTVVILEKESPNTKREIHRVRGPEQSVPRRQIRSVGTALSDRTATQTHRARYDTLSDTSQSPNCSNFIGVQHNLPSPSSICTSPSFPRGQINPLIPPRQNPNTASSYTLPGRVTSVPYRQKPSSLGYNSVNLAEQARSSTEYNSFQNTEEKTTYRFSHEAYFSPTTLYIYDLPHDVSARDLTALLKGQGRYSIKIFRDGSRHCYAQVTFDTQTCAAAALRDLSGRHYGGRKISVSTTKRGNNIVTTELPAEDLSRNSKSMTPFKKPGPLIVNGAKGRVRRRRNSHNSTSSDESGNDSC